MQKIAIILILLILRILESQTDKYNPLTQVEITNMISPIYPCDRKTVGRNIKFLTLLKYPIVKTPKGFYMDAKAFDSKEIQYVIDSVIKNPNSYDDKTELCNKLNYCLRRNYSKDFLISKISSDSNKKQI